MTIIAILFLTEQFISFFSKQKAPITTLTDKLKFLQTLKNTLRLKPASCYRNGYNSNMKHTEYYGRINSCLVGGMG